MVGRGRFLQSLMHPTAHVPKQLAYNYVQMAAKTLGFLH
jgi:hypothetical protein